MRLGDRGAVRVGGTEVAPGGPSGQRCGAGCARPSPCRRPRTGRGIHEANHDHRNVDPGARRTAPQLCCSRPDLQSDRCRDRRHAKRRHRQNPSPRPLAGAARGCAGACLPSARPAAAASFATAIAALDRCRNDRWRSATGCQHAGLLTARTRAGQVPLAAQRARRRGFRLLRQRCRCRLPLLCRPRPLGVSAASAAARLRGRTKWLFWDAHTRISVLPHPWHAGPAFSSRVSDDARPIHRRPNFR